MQGAVIATSTAEFIFREPQSWRGREQGTPACPAGVSRQSNSLLWRRQGPWLLAKSPDIYFLMPACVTCKGIGVLMSAHVKHMLSLQAQTCVRPWCSNLAPGALGSQSTHEWKLPVVLHLPFLSQHWLKLSSLPGSVVLQPRPV